MPDYSKAKIYIIRSPHTEDVYIGSTVQPLSSRMGSHRKDYEKYLKNEGHFVTSYKLLELGDAYIELVAHCPCNNREELEKLEGYYMRNTSNCVNKNIAGRTKQEYYLENKERINEIKKIYNTTNKETIKQQQKQYYEQNKEHINKMKQLYNEANKEEIKEQRKQYREENKEKIKAHKSLTFVCECGAETTIDHKSRHLKSRKHHKYLEEQQ